MRSIIENRPAPRAFTLPSGLRLVCCPAPVRAEYFGVAVNAGSRDEHAGEFGLAHFVEHTIFKGTAHRRACHILNRMESVGGELNAFTSKEETYVYSLYPAGYLTRAAELISDLVHDSVFPPSELDKERAVIEDEIDVCLDTPAERVYDDFEDEFFSGSQLGHNILGTASSLRSLGSDDCRRWLARNYTGCRLTVFYFGPEEPARVRKVVERYFGDLPAGSAPERVAPTAVMPFTIRREADSHQANTVIGAALPDIHSPMRYAIGLLVNILGGQGMNSRLNVALRERRGLVYTVEASTTLYSDCGLFTVYYGCDPEDNDRCLELVLRELRRAATEPLTPRALDAARRQYLGQMLVSGENMEQVAMNAARSMMYHAAAPDTASAVRAIEAITPGDLLEAATYMRPEVCSALTLG